MKKLVALGLLLTTAAFAGTAFADDGTLQDQKLQKLFEWSAQAPRQTGSVPPVAEIHGLLDQKVRGLMKWSNEMADQATERAHMAGPVPPYQQYPGFKVN